jgi:hypothetical protein
VQWSARPRQAPPSRWHAELIDPTGDVATLAFARRRATRFHHRRGVSVGLAKHLLRAELKYEPVLVLARFLLAPASKRKSGTSWAGYRSGTPAALSAGDRDATASPGTSIGAARSGAATERRTTTTGRQSGPILAQTTGAKRRRARPPRQYGGSAATMRLAPAVSRWKPRPNPHSSPDLNEGPPRERVPAGATGAAAHERA